MATERFLPFSVYYLRVTLEDSKPAIWRDILVPNDLTLEGLHYVIQAVMGWGNCHRHQFIAENVIYTNDLLHNEDDEYGLLDGEDLEKQDRSEKKYTVAHLLSKEDDTIIYEYDLGDSWTHQVKLKKILPVDANAHQPRCIKGEKACPPEDCGGIWGYTDMLDTLRNTEHSENTQILAWFGEDFNPDHFDIEAVNRTLRHLMVDDLDAESK
jgi:hypothetical protein